jgi:rubrerythrin
LVATGSDITTILEWCEHIMSYTNPYGQPQGTARQVTNKLRQILIAEIIAINGYQSHIANSNMVDINNSWHSIMEDEKKHYGLVLGLLRKYDPEEYKQYLAHKTDLVGPKEPMQIYNPDFNIQIILNNLREDIKGEFEAVVLYEEELPEFPYKDVRTVVRSIIDEEKGHTEHLTNILLK